MYLVLLETSGNQNYIFSTNKLRENVGASELTYRAGTQWVLDVVGEINNTQSFRIWKNSKLKLLRENLTNPSLNPPIEELKKPVEIVIAASGKAVLITKEEDTAKKIITKVTTRALKDAPGIDLCGVFVEFDWHKEGSIITAIKEMYRKFEEVHGKYPSPNLRFQRLPIIDECSTSGFPASQLNPKDKQPISIVSYQKQEHLKESLQRINGILPSDGEIKFVKKLDQLEQKFDNLDWLGVIHADGNGLGQIFLNFHQYLDNEPESEEFNREYVDTLRKFSIALDICTEKAFLSAIKVFKPDSEGIIPLLPLVLGGDDLTVICDGKFALKFTHRFLREFEAETANLEHQEGIIPKIASHPKAFGIGRLSACAGIAIIKPHFPFSVAYELAESLIKQAKNVKKKVLTADNKPFPCSAIDFHVLYDSSGVELESIRKKLTVDEGKTKLYNQPYIITDKQNLETAQGLNWAEFHHWEKLEKQVDIIPLKEKATETQENQENQIPMGQLNNLRLALFSGREIADAQYKLISQRYDSLKELEAEKDSLFAIEPDSENIYTTGLVDALSAVEFWR